MEAPGCVETYVSEKSEQMSEAMGWGPQDPSLMRDELLHELFEATAERRGLAPRN